MGCALSALSYGEIEYEECIGNAVNDAHVGIRYVCVIYVQCVHVSIVIRKRNQFTDK